MKTDRCDSTLAKEIIYQTNKLVIMSEKLKTFTARDGQLSLTDAEDFTKNWITKGIISEKEFRAFSVRKTELDDLLARMTLNGLDAVRFYLGMKPKTNGEEGLQPCLIMAGVKGFEVDFINPDNPVVTNVGKEQYFPDRTSKIEGEFVYDFAYPCPDTCQNNSPLMPPSPAAGRTY
jgi:hypothetical protein